MFIQPKLEMRIRTRINQSNPVFLPGLKCQFRVTSTPVKLILPTDEPIGRRVRGTRDPLCEKLLESSNVEPICQRKWTEINVPVGA